ncbi:MAG: serine hydrolase, partial [Hyphomicrobiaceae bacterium]|nr:serine hydrolase [Hyphomicrobiaceae bacterium]
MHSTPARAIGQDNYVPDATDWAGLSAADAGFDGARLDAAVAFALAHDSPWPRSLYHADGRYVGNVEWNETGPWSEIVGPVLPRGGPAGVVLKGGRVLAHWGDTLRPDMTFSVAKSYLAVLAGLAVADGSIADIDEPVGATVKGRWFASQHNARVTWRHLLQQSSEWQGELWGKSDQVDHNRQTGAGADQSRKGQRREPMQPGTYFEYNDVRVNLLAFCLLQRFGRPLPDVLRERVMDPIGASRTWEWHGYSTSWTEVGGRRVQSVAGGGHWGGGMVISARDHARLGLLMARGGRWGERQVLPESWVRDTFSPSSTNPGYGHLWWLNAGAARRPAAPP